MKISGSAHDHFWTPTFHLLASYARKFPCLEINVAMDENCNKIPGVGGGGGGEWECSFQLNRNFWDVAHF